MRILITGAGGQLASDLRAALADHDVQALPRSQLDITDRSHVAAAFETYEPDVAINTAAYNAVDAAESDVEAAFRVNTIAPRYLAEQCAARGALLIHFSTDYVFDGEARAPYVETDPLAPINIYGVSKAAGEMAVRATTDRHLILRVCGLYGVGGMSTTRGNFVETMLRLGARGGPVSVVDSQTLTPTATADVADVVRELLTGDVIGTYHVTNSGACSWHQFAREIFRLARMDVDLRPTSQDLRPTPARRPVYSVLAHAALLEAGLPDLRPWQEALASYLEQRAAVAGG